MSSNAGAEAAVRDIRRKTRKQYSAEEKIRIVLSGLRGEDSIAELCRREGIAESLYYSWSKEFLEAGKNRLSGDTARQASSGEVNYYSVCTTWLTKGDDYYLLDVLRERLDYPHLRMRVIEMNQRFAAHSVLIKDKGSGTQLIQDLRYGKTGVRPIDIKPECDKITRKSNQSATIQAGHVFMPEDAPWLVDFKAEILAFPGGRYDDQVDSLSQFLGWAEHYRRFRPGNGRVFGMY
jgi:predicted phage terminase large subunit-like protein